MSPQGTAEHYKALVDMGSNGIRFSISDLSPPLARVMPTVYQDRCGISLYDAQHHAGERIPIPQFVIDETVAALLRFKRITEDFKVPTSRVQVVATEATRTALNSDAFREHIENATGWKVDMLAKEEEGRIGAMGVASSFGSIKGLVLDLGGGSIQMTWMISEAGKVKTSPKGAVSFPYGAAALMMRLGEVGIEGHASLRQEMSANFETALQELGVPDTLVKDAEAEGGLTLYLSGGGFRGWGYILMSLHSITPYPIPIINGFRIPKSSFEPNLEEHFSDPDSTFRISARRASQVPAIAFLIRALTQSVPSISYIYFAQGGIREGLLFTSLPPSIRSQHPLTAVTQSHAPPSSACLFHMLTKTIPQSRNPATATDPPAALISPVMLASTTNLLYAHESFPKDIRAAAALRSTTTGLLGNAHGLSHTDRALLALILCERWGGEISPTDEQFLSKSQELVGPRLGWWAKYIGRAAGGIGDLFPAGVVRSEEEDLVGIMASWGVAETKKGREETLDIVVDVQIDGMEEIVNDYRRGMEKVGKKKNWVGGWGLKVRANPEGCEKRE
ncbi:MAG: hypothetical protein Q9177_001002 [Variospora cf. flavescens]